MAADGSIRVERAAYALDGKPILRGVDAVFPAGTVTLLLGPNGSGKTMLLEVIAGLRKPDEGQVRIDGEPLWRGKKPNRRLLLRLGLAMQHPEQMLFARTVREEFAYSLKPFRLPDRQRIAVMNRSAVAWLDDGRSGKSRPSSGWPDRDPLALSGGQRRRLALALTEAPGPDWLLCDEPTAGLDGEIRERLRDRIRERRAQGKGAIVVTHDADEWLEMADQVVLLRDGRVVWAGPPHRLAETPDLWRKAGLDPPEPLVTAERLRRAGFHVPSGRLDPEAWAEALAAALPSASKDPKAIGEPAGRPGVPPAGGMPEDEAADDGRPDMAANEDRPDKAAEEGRLGDAAGVESAIGGWPADPAKAGRPSDAASDGEPCGAANVRTDVAETGGSSLEPEEPAKPAATTSPLDSYDPRALWLACLAITAGIGLQSAWPGWFAGLMASVVAIRFSGVPARVFVRPAKALLLFALVTSLAAAWEPSADAAFRIDAFLATFRRFSKLAMMALLGFSLMAGISPWRLKTALENGLAPLAKIGVPVGTFALASALLLRFLPMLLESWDRFARIAASRGKRPLKPGAVPFSLVAMTVMPFLLDLIRLGEALSAQLAVRGAGRSGAGGTAPHVGKSGASPSFTRRDARLVAAAGLVLAAFLLI